ncbi:hypothetical protein O6H91_22G012500 [Diphasiastrum complanatum]|uniref:Uncharacterized protein n=3 Tax=Diphasiastrum complanatum TaxID=34168 RepID=A0ACC2AEY0_DIPCM|nr:hypothetical protein O6H91_22G012500 [Diphasiastrum complanatum]KAJ7515411.1 hypothetical protein O6H91_22G012500 [Diphasiastrum complanatum]KAJ7515412.1 hypothetical protein O6H91_22G012500 [Diphasiastrum complanatum]
MSSLAVVSIPNEILDPQAKKMLHSRKRLTRKGSGLWGWLLKNLCRWWGFLLAAGALFVLLVEVGNLSKDAPKPLSVGLSISNKKGLDREDSSSSIASSYIKKEKKNHLDDLSMPTRRVGGMTESCLKLLSQEEIKNLQFPPSANSFNVNIHYKSGTADIQNQNSEGIRTTNSFTGNQTMSERADSFEVHNNVEVHCGFFSQNSGFDIEDDDKSFMNTCEAVVSTCIFGGGDVLYQPIGMANTSLTKVCYVAFLDNATFGTIEEAANYEHEAHKLGIWRIVVVHNLPFPDQRRNGKIPKMLGHRLFPKARYSIWVDSKYQFRRDPMAVLEALLWREKSTLAISEHGARKCVYKEGEAVVKKHKALPEEVALQLDQYRGEGFAENAIYDGHKALAEASVIVREHNPLTNLFMCLWFNEVVRFTARDQLSFPYVLCRFKLPHLKMFSVCTRRALVNALGHKHKAKQLEQVEIS